MKMCIRDRNYTSKLRIGLWLNGVMTLAEENAAIANPAIWDQQVPNPYYQVASMVGNGCGQGKTVQAIDLLLPLSQYCNAGGNSVTGQPNFPMGHNWYNGMEVKLTKRMQGGATQGLTFQVSYTWSKTINGDGYLNGWPYQDPRQIHYLAGSDRTNVAGITTVYDLPFGKGGMRFRWRRSSASTTNSTTASPSSSRISTARMLVLSSEMTAVNSFNMPAVSYTHLPCPG